MLQTYPRTSRSSHAHNWQLVFSSVDEVRTSARMQIPQLPLDKRSDMFPLHDDRQHRSQRKRMTANSVYPRILERSAGNQTVWWSQTGSNRRPHACKARALPTELWPRAGKNSAPNKMVGLGRLELPTSRLSSARSNQLSYKPNYCPNALAHVLVRKVSRPLRDRRRRAGSSLDRRKRNEDGGCPARSA